MKMPPSLLSWRSDSWRSDGRTDSFSDEYFKRRNQFKRLLLACMLRWFMTAVLVMGTYLVLWRYSREAAMISAKKKEFNTLIIALSIALGLNIASSLKHLVRELRWWVLSWHEWMPIEVGNAELRHDERKTLLILSCTDIHRPIIFCRARTLAVCSGWAM